MPTYEYRCQSCRRQFEKFQSIMAKSTTPCPTCKKTARRQISTGGGVIFKGTGFYGTDYRSSGYKKQAAAEAKKPTTEPATGSSAGRPSAGKPAPVPSAPAPCSSGKPASN